MSVLDTPPVELSHLDTGPWPRMSHAERAGYLRAIADELRKRVDQVGDIWPRESGILGIAFGGFKQSGLGREGGTEGLLPFLQTKTVILNGRPGKYADA